MNWEHFRAFLWLRWRLFMNSMRRGGAANAVVLIILIALMSLFSLGLSVTFFFVGLSGLSSVTGWELMLVWDGLAGTFLIFWLIGLALELQRSEVLSLEKFLHLPVSLRGAFVINYLSSLICPCIIVFAPALFALALGLTLDRGPALLLQFPLLAAFILMVTALTYQFQGWLASLMANPRRRRTVIVMVTMGIVLLVQLPNFVNIAFSQRHQPQQNELIAEQSRELTELGQERQSDKINDKEYTRRAEEIKQKYDKRAGDAAKQSLGRVEHAVRLFNMVLPPGWLPLGSADAATGQVLTALLGTLGMGLIGTASLWRAYRTTIRLYTGQISLGKRKPATPPAAPAAPATPQAPATVGLLERQVPGISERAGAIALTAFRSLLRAPEAKMLLLSPVILVLVFGSLFWARSGELPMMVRPLVVFGAMSAILLSMSQLAGNQFGFDRAGFRVYVLSAAPRRDILLGKNLALASIALGLSLILVAALEVLEPLSWEHLLAVLPQFVCMYLPYCMVTNFLSMIAPMAIRAGSFKAYHPKGFTILLHLVFAFLSPLMMLPALLPLGIEYLLQEMGWLTGVPICLILSLLEAAAMIGIYRLVVGWEGSMLQAHEQIILDVVTARTE